MRHYLYRHIRLDTNQPFYIGVGTKYKKNYASIPYEYGRAYEKLDRNPIWNNITNKTEYRVEILYESNNYKEILNKEIDFIKLYGRIKLNNGSLVNLTEGGEGVVDITGEVRKKISEKLKGIKRSNETIEKIKQARKLQVMIPHSDETKIKIGLSNKGKNNGMFGKIGYLSVNSKPIIQYDLKGNFIKEWSNAREITTMLNIDYRQISDCCNGKQKTTKGFIWKFKKKEE